ncbi:FkbM family methyltransferase [Arundinibacter roseus]|uniref:FkbM family methyltransferase n=1 Tax=Arundinibacter roseus TaxID=2070510 RepID=A0A4R4K244_9BACT|nr:FkbM family methyltransferase [Arundinibacter roseus]TDB61377.1 FkbM family methyltransferase [Arundinibacter roseus]
MFWLRQLLKESYHALRTPRSREFMRLLWRYGDRPRHQLTDVSFGNYRLRVPDTMSFLFQHQEIFADEYYHFQSDDLQPVILDCGANVGMSVLYFKELFPQARITAFEAEAEIADLLKNNLETNGINDVTVIAKAVWVHADGVLFGSEASDSSSIFSENSAKQLVPSVRLRDVIMAEKRIDFLKIDIEGAEIEVLEDCRESLAHVQNLFVEFHSYIDHPQSLASVVRVFEENGFRYFIDTNQHRKRPFVNHRYRGNDSMDLQLNIFGYRP